MAQGLRDYPGSAERLYGWLRRQPWLIDGTLAILLPAGSANEYGNPAVLPATLALAGAVTVRLRFPVGAYAAALAVGLAQVIGGIGPTFTNSPLQSTFADTGILVLLYTVAARRPRRISLSALAACMAEFAAAAAVAVAVAVARWNPGSGARAHPVEFALVTGVIYVLAPGDRVGAWRLDGLPVCPPHRAGGSRCPGRAGAGRSGADRRRG